ncbi:MAG: PDDEXK nuclease domain-containing protein [Deltaproteobacteria bacterium]|nr:PDDEXK nuclease domain-containing protein [Deltaproteobacteria bacterium]
MPDIQFTPDYTLWLSDLKQRISLARQKASLTLNAALIELYWEIGRDIVEKEEKTAWGSGLIERLSRDLAHAFPDMKGFSRRNLYAVRQWYLFYSAQSAFVPQPVAQMPWGHNRLIVSKIKDYDEALWYALAANENGWTRDDLELKIEKREYKRVARALTNFPHTLPAVQSGLARETLKDPYNFDFLGLEDEAQERAIEAALTYKITDFLLELGKGFAFVGRQVKLLISDNEYFLDMLFYHLDLRCYIVIELKAGKFKPEYAGKLNFYLSAVDAQLKRSDDNPSIGILLCKKKDKIEVEYSLKDINKPIGVSDYLLTHAIPDNLVTKLPTVAELENELAARIIAN